MTEQLPDTFPTMDQRARDLGIRIEVSTAKREWDDDRWEHDRYRVRLTRQGRQLTTVFRKGTGHQGNPPQIDEVLDALVSDAASVDEDYYEWCSSLGYAPSRKVEATYKACQKIRRDLERLVGSEVLEDLMYRTERL